MQKFTTTREETGMVKINRRTLLQAAAATASVSGLSFGRAYSQSNTIRIGFAAPLSGAQQVYGGPLRIGAEVARDEINAAGGIGGKMIELVVRDDKGDPNQAVSVVRELVGSGVNLIAGIPLTATALATAGIIESINGVYIATGTGEEKLTHENFTRHFFTAAENNYTRLHAYGKLMAERHPDVTTWTAIFPDVTVGHASWGHMMNGLKDYYKSVAKKDVTFIDPVVTKYGATDFKSQIVSLLSSPAQGLHSVLFGGDGITFFQQAQQLGLPKKMAVITDQSLDLELPRALQKNTPENVWLASQWYAGSFEKYPESQALLKAYQERANGTYPIALTAISNTAVRAFGEALKVTKGDTDSKRVIDALETVKLNTVKGPAYFRKEDHQIITQGSYFRAGPKDAPPGWEVKEAINVDYADITNPPKPGVPM
jgi:branched-chain amino acid transport system substrate-binding protein